MLEILSGVLAKLAALGVAGKAVVGVTAASAAIAAAGATGALPDLPEPADRGGAQQQSSDVGGVTDVETETPEDAGEPAPQASFGQSVAEAAREHASTGSDRAEQGASNGDDGQDTADDAPDSVEDAPAGTPAENRPTPGSPVVSAAHGFDEALAAARPGPPWALTWLFRTYAGPVAGLPAGPNLRRDRRPGQRGVHLGVHRPRPVLRRRVRLPRLAVHRRAASRGRRAASPTPRPGATQPPATAPPDRAPDERPEPAQSGRPSQQTGQPAEGGDAPEPPAGTTSQSSSSALPPAQHTAVD